MKLSDLKPDEGARKRKRRLGRGISAGQGKTAGRGTKGQGARSGGGKGRYFEGGQLPLVRRLPFKRGFTNLFRIEYREVNLDKIQEVFSDGDTVNPKTLAEKGLIREEFDPVVILGRGELSIKVDVHAHRITAGARQKLEAAGGSFTEIHFPLTKTQATIRRPSKDVLEALRQSGSQD